MTVTPSAFPSSKKKPHRSASTDNPDWTATQKRCNWVLRSSAVEATLGVLIGVSFILVIIETDASARGDVPGWIAAVNYLLLAVYTVELVVRLYLLRVTFFYSFFNLMDMAVVLIDWFCTLIELFVGDSFPSLTVLRIFRVLRLARSFKIMVKFPQLALMVKGLVNALSAVMYGVALLFVVLTVWSICAVQFIDPVNKRIAERGVYREAGCSRCETAFASVRDSMITFIQQIIAGDSWGQVTIPIIEESPETGIFFALVFISVNLTIVNVMLAVIVDTAMKTSQEDIDKIVEEKQEEYNRAEKTLTRICQELDKDGSGDLTEEELMVGIDTHKEFSDVLALMDIGKDDMHLVFSILDTDGSGTVNYGEFVQELFKMKQHDSHTLLVFIKHYVTEIRQGLENQMKVLKSGIIERIVDELVHSQPHQQPLPRKLSDDLRQFNLLPSVGADLQSQPLGAAEPLLGKQLKGVGEEPPAGEARTGTPPLEQKAVPPQQEGPAEVLGEELRRLRIAISEDLLCSIRNVVEQSEAHTRLLTSIAREVPWRGGEAAPPPVDTLARDDLRAQQRRTPSGQAALQYPAVPQGRVGPEGQAAPQSQVARHIGATDPLELPQSGLPPMPPSTWGIRRCCGAQPEVRVQLSPLR